MSEREPVNRCKELACTACCHNVKMRIGSIQRERAFPEAVEIASDQNIDDITTGVVYKKTGKFVNLDYEEEVHINGACPNLSDNGDCLLYGTINRPPKCEQLKITDSACNIRRIETGREPIKKNKRNQSQIVFVPLDKILHEPELRYLRNRT